MMRLTGKSAVFAVVFSTLCTPEVALPAENAALQCWWHWMGGEVDRGGIVKDLDAMQSAGTVTITLPGGWIPRSGVYTLFSAPNAVNIEVLDSWTVSSPANCVRIQRVGNALVAEVTSRFMVIVR